MGNTELNQQQGAFGLDMSKNFSSDSARVGLESTARNGMQILYL